MNGREEGAISAVKSASSLIYVGKGFFHGYILALDGSNSVTATVYDNDAAVAAGNVIALPVVFPSSATVRAASYGVVPIKFEKGIYIVLTTGGTVGCQVELNSIIGNLNNGF